ncbi:hypothetical protein IVA81_07855 [Bradyrhizobium sp. 141]|nr:hypothetical protein [Bradyrhizobium sp. 141]
MLVDLKHGFLFADVAEHQLRLAGLGQDVRFGRRLRVLLHEMDRCAGILAVELQRGRSQRRDEGELDVVGADHSVMLFLPAELSKLGAVEGEDVAEPCGYGGFQPDAERRFDAPHQRGVNSSIAVTGRCGQLGIGIQRERRRKQMRQRGAGAGREQAHRK